MQNGSLNDETSGGSVRSSEVAEKLGAYVDGELSPLEREAVEMLLEKDKSCLEIVQSFRFLDEVARREMVPSVSAGEWARIWEAIQLGKDRSLASPEQTSGTRRERGGTVVHRRWLFRLAAAAAVVALALVGFEVIEMMKQPSGNGTDVVGTQPASSETPAPEEGVDKGAPDEDGEGVGVLEEGDAPDEIREDGVIYRRF